MTVRLPPLPTPNYDPATLEQIANFQKQMASFQNRINSFSPSSIRFSPPPSIASSAPVLQSPHSVLHEMAILTLGYLSLWGITALSINVLVRNITFTAEYQTSISLVGGAVVTILTYVNPAIGLMVTGILFLIAAILSDPYLPNSRYEPKYDEHFFRHLEKQNRPPFPDLPPVRHPMPPLQPIMFHNQFVYQPLFDRQGQETPE